MLFPNLSKSPPCSGSSSMGELKWLCTVDSFLILCVAETPPLSLSSSLVLALSSSPSHVFSPQVWYPSRNRAGLKLSGCWRESPPPARTEVFSFQQHVELRNQNTRSWLQGALRDENKASARVPWEETEENCEIQQKAFQVTVPRIWEKDKKWLNDTLSLNNVESCRAGGIAGDSTDNTRTSQTQYLFTSEALILSSSADKTPIIRSLSNVFLEAIRQNTNRNKNIQVDDRKGI